MPKDGIQEKLRLFRGKSVAFSKGTENTIRSIGRYKRVRFTENRKAVDELWLRGQAVKTSPFHGGNTGSIPVGVIYADVAQLAEQLICNQQVIGSSPIIGFKPLGLRTFSSVG